MNTPRQPLPAEQAAMMASPIGDLRHEQQAAELPLLHGQTMTSTSVSYDPQDSADLLMTPTDLESPGNVSQGSCLTTASDRSTHSRVQLLRHGER